MGNTRQVIRAFPEEVRDAIGLALYFAHGIATPQKDINLIIQRLAAARLHHAQQGGN